MNMPVDITSAASAEQSSSAASSHSAATPSQQLFGTTSLPAPATINLLSPAPGTRFIRRAVELEQAQARLRKPQDDSTTE
ncbi:hypothetical protein, partial [uncultured Cobetia sp.]